MIEIYDLRALLERPALREEMHELRYRQFYQKRRWDIPAVKNVEIDQYDRLAVNPVYFLARRENGSICGTCRLIRTTGPYMIRDLFADMLGSRPLPQSPAIWEATRIAVELDRGAKSVSRITAALLAAVCEFGIPKGMQYTIGTYEASVVRLFRARGVPASWVGEERSFVDSRCALAMHPVNAGIYRQLVKINNLPSPIIVHDATQLEAEAA